MTQEPNAAPVSEPASRNAGGPASQAAGEPRTEPAAGAKPASIRPNVEYKGGPLDAEKGPGLGCFWLQIVTLAVTVFLAPLSAAWNWPVPIVILLFALVIVLLLFVGQTIIFLLRLVAADRRTEARRRPMSSTASRTKTVGEIEDEGAGAESTPEGAPDRGAGAGPGVDA